MRFGVARDIITPTAPVKLACAGGEMEQNFLTVHDDVFVRCLVFDDGREKAVLMSFDLLFHDRKLNRMIAEYAEMKYGINPAAFVVSYIHAHTAPASRGYNPGAHDDVYEEFLVSRAKDCLDRAMCSLFEGSVEYGTFDADFNISRRGIVDGAYRIAPNDNYPHDTEFAVICVRNMEGDVRSVVMNYACHPVFYPGTRGVSGEFPARLCQYMDLKYYGCTSLFFQSAGGDVRPRPTADIENHKFNKMKFSDIDCFARNMCQSVSEFIESRLCKNIELSIAADAFEMKLPMEPKPISYFEKYLEGRNVEEFNPNVVNAYRIVNGGYDKLAHQVTVHGQTVRIAENFFVATLGGEPCFGVKQAVKSSFEGKDVCFIGYTDSCAYIVDDRILSEGGYEPGCHLEYGLIGPFKPGLDEKYREGFRASVKRLDSERKHSN